MRKKTNDVIYLIASIVGFFIMSMSIVIMPIDLEKSYPWMKYLPGILFWGFLLLSIACQVILAYRRKIWYEQNQVRRNRVRGCQIGALTFLQNLPACVADGCCVVSFIALIIAVIATKSRGYSCYIFLATLIFSFCMHCIFNGKIYYFIENRERILNLQLNKSEKE